MTDDVLRFDRDDWRIGDRVASSGWALPYHVRLMKADASGVTVFATGGVVHAPSHVKVGITVNGQEIEGRRVVLDDDYLVGEGPIVGVVEPRRAVLDDFLHLTADPSDAAILDYARRYGMLGLRPCDRSPAGMVYPNLPWVGDQVARLIGYQPAPGILREPLGLWRRVLREISAAYTIAGHLRLDQVVDRPAWAPLAGIIELPLGPGDVIDDRLRATVLADRPASFPTGPTIQVPAVPWIPVNPRTLDGQRQALGAVIGAWLALGRSARRSLGAHARRRIR